MSETATLLARRKRIYKLLQFLTEIEADLDPGGFGAFNPTGLDDLTIRRERRTHVECLREYEAHMRARDSGGVHMV
jgi:hypothetical protein